jgi:hypothetical protein
VVVTTPEGVDSVACLNLVDGRISTIRLVRNPDKLTSIAGT